jgi:hypothetical protein
MCIANKREINFKNRERENRDLRGVRETGRYLMLFACIVNGLKRPGAVRRLVAASGQEGQDTS